MVDIKITLENGHTVAFYGLKDSPLDKKIDQKNVEKYYHPGLVQTHFFLWPKLKRLAILLNDPNLDVLHCYKLNLLWPVCFFLRGNKDVSVILSQFFELKKNYRALWNRLLIRRCDLVYVPFNHLVKNVWSRLGVHPRRVEIRPPSLRSADRYGHSELIFERFEQFYSVGIYVSESDKEIKDFFPYLKALQVANEHFDWKKPIKLVFVTEGVWSEQRVYVKLKQKILDEGIEEHIIFYKGGSPTHYIQFFDLWMSFPSGEGLDDHALLATSIGTPILAPRHPSIVEFFDEFGKVGETHKVGDVRDIIHKWERTLSRPELYQDFIEKAGKKIREENSAETHKNQYLSVLKKIVSRRERYKHRKASSEV